MKKISMAIAATVVASTTVLAAPAASAIERAGCESSSQGSLLELHSNATTCWGNAGTIDVTLLNVQSYSAGSNDGWLLDSDGIRIPFQRGHQNNFTYAHTIVRIHID